MYKRLDQENYKVMLEPPTQRNQRKYEVVQDYQSNVAALQQLAPVPGRVQVEQGPAQEGVNHFVEELQHVVFQFRERPQGHDEGQVAQLHCHVERDLAVERPLCVEENDDATEQSSSYQE